MQSNTALDSKLKYDIYDITSNYNNRYNPLIGVECKLHTVEKDLDYKDGLSVIDLQIIRDYENNIADYIEIKLMILLGTYLYDIYNFLDNIEVTLLYTKQLKDNNNREYIFKQRYKAAYLLDKNKSIPNNITASKTDLNNQFPIVLTLQLLNRSAEVLRIKTIQGNFDPIINKNNNLSLDVFLKSVISEQANKILIENKKCIDSLYIESPDNKDKLKSITIPSGTRLVELPYIIQNKNIGIYNGGVGIYIQNFAIDNCNYLNGMFIYSLYDVSKYNSSEYKTIFYCPVSGAVSMTDITYKYINKVLKMVTQPLTIIKDTKETEFMSKGSGFRFANANSFMKKPVIMKETGPVFARNNLNTEVIFKDRKDNLNYAPNKAISSNIFKLTEEVLCNQKSYISLEVNNLDHDFILPNSKCKIVTEDKNGNIIEIYGVIHQVYITYTPANTNPVVNINSKVVSLRNKTIFNILVN